MNTDEAWEQVLAGIGLVTWSRLCTWNAATSRLLSTAENAFESGHEKVHATLGRLLSWITFAVGTEYIAKGACLLNGVPITTSTGTIVAPLPNDDLDTWAQQVMANAPTIRQQQSVLKTLGRLPIEKVFPAGPGGQRTAAAIKLLASHFRNRDAHTYAKSVRALHFYLIPSLFVPALNQLLSSVDQVELRARMRNNE